MPNLTYGGTLEVEDGCFTLTAERLIIRSREAGFTLSGTDLFGNFSMEGVAELREHGKYVATRLPLIYKNYDKQDQATLVFHLIQPTPQQVRCHIKAEWIQTGEAWRVTGSLKKLPGSR